MYIIIHNILIYYNLLVVLLLIIINNIKLSFRVFLCFSWDTTRRYVSRAHSHHEKCLMPS